MTQSPRPVSLALILAALVVVIPLTNARSQPRRDRPAPPKNEPAPAVTRAAPRPHSARPADATREPRPAPGPQVEMLCRKAWGARKVRPGLIKHTIKRLTVHHSGVAIKGNRRSPRRMRSVQNYHQLGKRWPDTAYHHLIDLEGNLYEGRDPAYRGDTGTTYDTTGHYLICVLGDYTRQNPNKKQLTTLVNLLAWASQHYRVGPETITGHRDHAATSCPGKNLYRLVKNGTLRRRVTAAAAAGTWKLVSICGAEGKKRIKAIEKGQ